jgi:hypothetical protein
MADKRLGVLWGAVWLATGCLPKADDDDSGSILSRGRGGSATTVWRDSGDWREDDDSTTHTGSLSGTFGLLIQDACTIVWAMDGEPSGDLRWDTDLSLTSSECDGIGDTSGSFELTAGSAYFSNNYIGAATYGAGAATWSTNGYITGVGGGSYYYVGSAAY